MILLHRAWARWALRGINERQKKDYAVSPGGVRAKFQNSGIIIRSILVSSQKKEQGASKEFS